MLSLMLATLIGGLSLVQDWSAADRVRSVVFHSYQTLSSSSDQPREIAAYGRALFAVIADADAALSACRLGMDPAPMDLDQIDAAARAMATLASQLDTQLEARLLEGHRQIGLLWMDLVAAEIAACPSVDPPEEEEPPPPPEEEEPPPPPPAGEYPRPTPTGKVWQIDAQGATPDGGATIPLPAPISNWHGNERSNGSIPERSAVASDGDVGLVQPGIYPNVRYATDRGPGWLFLRGETPGTVVVLGKSGADTWYNERGNKYELADLELRGVNGTRAIFKTDSGATSGGRYADIHLRNVIINGQFDAYQDVGRAWTKWGIHTYHMGYSNDPAALYGFVISGPAGVWQGGIGDEHWVYDHNPSAPGVLVENVWVRGCRRTGTQFTNRAGEGPDADARITVRNSRFHDCCLEDQGGGSVLTYKGQNIVQIWNVEVRLGADPGLARPYQDNITGAFVAEFQRKDTQYVELVDCDFQVGPAFVGKGSARRPNVQWQSVVRGEIRNTRIAQAVGAAPALSFSPGPIVSVTLQNNDVRGDVLWGGQKFSDRDADGDGWYDGDGYAAFLAWAEGNEPRVIIE